MRNDLRYHLFLLGITYVLTEMFFGTWLRVYKSTNKHRQLEPHYIAEMEYKKKMAELEEEEDDGEDDEDEDDDDDDDDD